VAESDIQRALDEVVEFIRALPVDSDDYDDLSMCQEVVTQKVRESAPAFVRRWPILFTLLAATSSEQVIDTLIDLAIRSKCSLIYLTPFERSRLSEAGLSSREQLLLGRLRERLKDDESSS